MKIGIKRIDNTLELPKFETAGAVGFDILAREQTVIPSKEVVLVPGNIIIEIPEGYMLMVTSRSSTPRKKGLLTPHGLGVIDQDYCGPEDEILIQVYNFTGSDVVVERGERIAQGVFVPIARAEWVEIEEVTAKTRGGFGSSG